MKGKRVELLVIDPQFDFCDPNGSLFVGGADEDMVRLAKFVEANGRSLYDIHITLDTHHFVDIAHPIFWIDSNANHPDPFTIITFDDVRDGKWKVTNPQFHNRALGYVHTLTDNGRYPLCIWPPHCLIGTPGHNVVEPLRVALAKWEEDFAMVDYVTKGSNFWTEHYSAVQADVPDPEDPGTMLNTRLIETLEDSDIILIAGEALSHCVANTIRDIANNFGEDNIKKFYLLEDCSSNVTGFDQMGIDFVGEMVNRGMNLTTTTKFRFV